MNLPVLTSHMHETCKLPRMKCFSPADYCLALSPHLSFTNTLIGVVCILLICMGLHNTRGMIAMSYSPRLTPAGNSLRLEQYDPVQGRKPVS